MQRNHFSILFFIKKTKFLKNGEAPICLRITVNGKRAEIQIKRTREKEEETQIRIMRLWNRKSYYRAFMPC